MKIATIFAIAAVTLVSCSKDDNASSGNNNTGNISEKTRLITLKPWKLTGKTYHSNANPQETDIFSFESACTLDNTYSYKTDNKVVTDDGAIKCNAAAPQTREDTWSFQNGETELKVGTYTNTLVSIDENTMILQHKITDYVYTEKFTH